MPEVVAQAEGRVNVNMVGGVDWVRMGSETPVDSRLSEAVGGGPLVAPQV